MEKSLGNDQHKVGQYKARLMLADMVSWIHIGITAFFALGWALPWRSAWWLVVFGGCAMHVVWCVNKNNCPLTLLEMKLRGQLPHESGPGEEQPHFVAGLLSGLFNRPVSARVGDVVVYGVLYISLSITAFRLIGS